MIWFNMIIFQIYLAELNSPHSELTAGGAIAVDGDTVCWGEGGGGNRDPPGGGGSKPPPPVPAPPRLSLPPSLPSFFYNISRFYKSNIT